ncbi:MAG: zinc metallopeptidase [Chromatiales bacterium]|nr:zinc metallopeptidase [Chromatiales bacterium]
MHALFFLALLAVLVFVPQWWVRRTLARYNRDEWNFPGTGGEFARHLLDHLDLKDVQVESAGPEGDHYDPTQRVVRLAEDKIERNSLTAIVTAAHEVGHAVQHRMHYGPFLWRMRIAKLVVVIQRVGSFLLFAVPVLTLVTRMPSVGLITLLIGLLTMGSAVILQLVTLPVEWDASFTRAQPILQAGYLREEQYAAADRILKACALTYFAAALANLLNFWAWLRMVRP